MYWPPPPPSFADWLAAPQEWDKDEIPPPPCTGQCLYPVTARPEQVEISRFLRRRKNVVNIMRTTASRPCCPSSPTPTPPSHPNPRRHFFLVLDRAAGFSPPHYTIFKHRTRRVVQLGLKGTWLHALGSGKEIMRIERLDGLMAEQRRVLASSEPQALMVPVARPLDVGHLEVCAIRLPCFFLSCAPFANINGLVFGRFPRAFLFMVESPPPPPVWSCREQVILFSCPVRSAPRHASPVGDPYTRDRMIMSMICVCVYLLNCT